MSTPNSLPAVVYASFAGSIDQQAVNRIFFNLGGATQRGVSTVHLLFQSNGGSVNDGIALYNYLRVYPLELHIYNGGSVQSIAVLAYLGAQNRHVSLHGNFLIHKTRGHAAQGIIAPQIKALLASVLADDVRTEAIYRAHTQIPRQRWALHKRQDVLFNSSEAVQFGIANDIREFVVPAGNQIFNI